MEEIWTYRFLFFNGLLVTLTVGITSLLIAAILGFLGALAKIGQNRTARRIAEFYTTIVRGIPDLVLMLILYYGGQQLLNDLGDWTGLWGYVEINHFTAGVGTIGFFFGAYMTETFRGAYLAIPKGQIEAAYAYGMSHSLAFRRVIFPQLARFALPSFTNNWLVLIKTTALVSVIGLQDIVYQANAIGKKLHQPFTFLFVVLVVYLGITALSDIGLRWLDRRVNVGVRRG